MRKIRSAVRETNRKVKPSSSVQPQSLSFTSTRQSVAHLTLERFLAPLDSSTFFKQFWEKAPLHVARDLPGWCKDLPRKEDLDELVDRTPTNDIRIVRSDGSQAHEALVSSARKMLSNYQAYADGWTLVLTSVYRRSLPVAMLAAKVAEALGHDVGVNLYFTPPDSQGFRPHVDGHDVFILQLAGRKAWRVYANKIDLPLEKQPYTIEDGDLRNRTMECTLSPGHLMYIPRGFIHDGVCTADASMHLTIGVHSLRWVELLHAILDAAANRDVRFRRTLSRDALEESSTERLAREVKALLVDLDNNDYLDEATAELRRRIAASSSPATGGQFEAIDRARSIDCTSRLARRTGLRAIVEPANGKVEIRFGSNRVAGPPTIEPALEFIASNQTFRVGDLPDNLADSSKVTLCRRLVRDGLLTVEIEKENRNETAR